MSMERDSDKTGWSDTRDYNSLLLCMFAVGYYSIFDSLVLCHIHINKYPPTRRKKERRTRKEK